MHTTTRLPRRTNSRPTGDRSARTCRVRALVGMLFAGLVIGVAALPGGSGEAPPTGPPTWQEIAASTSAGVDGN